MSDPMAAGAVESIVVAAGTQRAKVLRMFVALGGPCTAECLEHATGLRGSSVRPRLVELRDGRDGRCGGLVRNTGESGMTRSGRKAELWTITEMGRNALDNIDREG